MKKIGKYLMYGIIGFVAIVLYAILIPFTVIQALGYLMWMTGSNEDLFSKTDPLSYIVYQWVMNLYIDYIK